MMQTNIFYFCTYKPKPKFLTNNTNLKWTDNKKIITSQHKKTAMAS